MTEQETKQESYDRGKQDGTIEAELREQRSHLVRINGSQEKFARELERMNNQREQQGLNIQALADAAKANERTAIALATALKEADEARRNQDTAKWSPLTRLGVGLGVLVSIATLGGIIYAIIN